MSNTELLTELHKNAQLTAERASELYDEVALTGKMTHKSIRDVMVLSRDTNANATELEQRVLENRQEKTAGAPGHHV